MIFEYDGDIVREEQYNSLDEMNENVLSVLDYDDLVSLSEDEKASVIAESTGIDIDEDIPLFSDESVFKEMTKTEDDKPFKNTQGEQLSLFGFDEIVPEKTEKQHKTNVNFKTPETINGVDTKAELTKDILRGSGFENGKNRISKYYEEQKPSTKEFADFLKHEYGIGGHTADDPVAFVDYSTKGIEFTLDENSKTDGKRFGFNWTEVAKQTAVLIDKGEYLTDKEIEKSVETPVQEAILSENTNKKQSEEKTENFTITDNNLGEGGAKTKFKNNLLAIQTLKQIESEDRTATPKEQEIMSKYVGWGGLSQAFDSENKAWENEFKQLRDVLNDTEYNDARARKSIFKNIYLFYEKM